MRAWLRRLRWEFAWVRALDLRELGAAYGLAPMPPTARVAGELPADFVERIADTIGA